LAVRIEFFTIAGTGDFELVPPEVLDAAVAAFDAGTASAGTAGAAGAVGPVRCVGWLSASDEDEERFTDWCEEVDRDLGTGLLSQGVDEAAGLAAPETLGSAADAGEWESAWSATLRGALAAAAGGRIGWRTGFDVAGTAGTPDDYPTEAHPAG
jgi:hypothetical protein